MAFLLCDYKKAMQSCVICYTSCRNVDKNGIKCASGHHYHCYACLEKGQIVDISRSGWPAWRFRCACCRTFTYAVLDKIDSLPLARALIREYQEKLREEESD